MVKKIADYALEIFTLVGITLSDIFIIQCENTRFYASLFTQINLLSAVHIYSFAQQRMFLSAMLYTLGIACILLCLVSYESREFLRCSRLFFLASGFVISIWDDEFIFYINKYHALLWSRIGDICLIFLTVCLYRILISECKPIHDKSLLKIVNYVVGLLAAGTALCIKQIQMLYVLKAFWIYSLFYAIIFIFITFHEQHIKNNLVEILLKYETITLIVSSILINALLYIVAFYKIETMSKIYAFYNGMLSYLFLIAVLIFFLVFIQFHRMGIVFGGEANLKLKEIERYRCRIANSLVSYYYTPINNLIYYNSKLEEIQNADDKENQKKIRAMMEKEIYRMKKHLLNMNIYQNAGDEGFYSSAIKINIMSIINNAISFACSDIHVPKDTFQWKDGNFCDYFIKAEPYALVQSIYAIFSTLYDINDKNGQILITFSNVNKMVRVEFSTTFPQKNFSLAKRTKKIMGIKEKVPRLVYDEDIMLYNAQRYLNFLNTDPSVTVNSKSRTIRFQCQFNQWEDEQFLNCKEENNCDCSNKAEKIILLSTSPEQIDIIGQYLKPEPYQLYIFNTEKDVYAFLKQADNIGLIIVGNLFFGYATDKICEKIREIYPMDQLPIIVICRNDYKRLDHNNNILKYVNDILIEPFEQTELVQKVYLLMLLRKSAQETLKAKIDFLQSQIDPHFIFNTLSSIMPLCIQDPKKAYKLLSDFSDYLRGRLYPKELQNPIPIYEEMDLIDAFLSIERVRFPDKIIYNVVGDYDENDLILPLLIEPIVENCIRHGMKPGQHQILHIYIGIKEQDGYLAFIIKDDGNGMDEDQLQKIRADDYISTTSIGFSNVKKRLVLYYSEKLNVNSIKGHGTEVTFKIPIQKNMTKREEETCDI